MKQILNDITILEVIDYGRCLFRIRRNSSNYAASVFYPNKPSYGAGVYVKKFSKSLRIPPVMVSEDEEFHRITFETSLNQVLNHMTILEVIEHVRWPFFQIRRNPTKYAKNVIYPETKL